MLAPAPSKTKNDIIHFVYSVKDLEYLGLMDNEDAIQLAPAQFERYYNKYMIQLLKEDLDEGLPYDPYDANIVIYQEGGYFYLFEV